MTTVLAISPHLDDAVFSAGGTLAGLARGGARVIVLTCFTASVAAPTGFALACQLDKGLGPEVDYMKLRRDEDRAACDRIGAATVHLPHCEAPHRGYDSAAALFGPVRADDAIAPALAQDVARAYAAYRPGRVFGPIGIGNHVDHVQVRRALEIALSGAELTLWADYPYAMRAPAECAGLAVHTLSKEDAAAREAAVLAYASQIGFQFGGEQAARDAFAAHPREWFTTPIIPSQQVAHE